MKKYRVIEVREGAETNYYPQWLDTSLSWLGLKPRYQYFYHFRRCAVSFYNLQRAIDFINTEKAEELPKERRTTVVYED